MKILNKNISQQTEKDSINLKNNNRKGFNYTKVFIGMYGQSEISVK